MRENASQVTQLDYLGKGEQVGWGPIAFSPRGDILASAHYEGSIKLYEMETGNLLGELSSDLGWVGSIAFSPDGKLIAVGGGNYDPKGIGVEIWDPASLEQKYVLENFDEPVLDLVFSPDGTLLATAASNPWGCCASVKLWNVKTRELVAELPVTQDVPYGKAVGVFNIAFNPKGTLLAAIRSDGIVVFADVVNQQIAGKVSAIASRGTGVAISPDGKLLAASGSANEDDSIGDLRLWDLATGKLLFKLVENGFRIDNVAFNIDGTVLASSDICLRLWDVKTGESLKVLNGAFVTDFAFSPDGTLLVTKGQDNVIRIWGIPAH
jgi:WD40 repeat protein